MAWVAFFILSAIAGYWLYGKKLENVWGADIYRSTNFDTSEENYSHVGMRYLQIAYFLATLSFETVLSVTIGYLYGINYVAWCVFGAMFLGGVLSYYCGMFSVRNGGKTIIYAYRQNFGAFCHYLIVAVVLSGIVLLMGATASEFININNSTFNVPIKIIAVYGVLACMIACCCSNRQFAVIYGGVGIFAVGLLIYTVFFSLKYVGSIDYSQIKLNFSGFKRAYPMVMFLCSIGTINCLQGLQSSLISPLLKNEKMGKSVFFGGIMFQSVFIVLFSAVVQAWNPSLAEYNKVIISSRTWFTVLQNLLYNGGGSFGVLMLFCLFVALFFSFCGGLVRVARNLIADTSIGFNSAVNCFLAIFLTMPPALILAKYKIPAVYLTLVAQCISVLCFIAVWADFIKNKRRLNTVLFPLYFVLGADVFYAGKLLAKFSETVCYSLGICITFALFAVHWYILHRKGINKWICSAVKASAVRQKNALGMIRRDWHNRRQKNSSEDMADITEKTKKSPENKQINPETEELKSESKNVFDEISDILDEPAVKEEKLSDDIFVFDNIVIQDNSPQKAKKKRKRKKKAAPAPAES